MNPEKKLASPTVKIIPLPSSRELLEKSWLMYRAKLRVIVLVSLLGVIPSLVAAILLAVIAAQFGQQANFLVINSSLALLMMLLLVYVSFRINIAIYLIVGQKISSIREAWQVAGKYFWSYTLTMLWMGAMLALWFLLLVVPGFIFLVFYSLVAWVFFIENYHGYAAIKRSRELITGYWKPVALRLLALFVPFFVLSILVDSFKNQSTADFISSIINFFFGIFVTIYTYQLYQHLAKIKGPSKIIQRPYQPWAYVLTVLAYILLMIALYLFVVFSPRFN